MPRYLRPDPATGATVSVMADHLLARILSSSPAGARAASHILWAATGWADRKMVGGTLHVQVTVDYVARGAVVSARQATAALQAFRADVDGGAGYRGWMALSHEALTACWITRDWLHQHGLLHEPAVAPPGKVFAFQVTLPPGKQRGKTRCGCGAHANGDRDPSLMFDLTTGLATCAVSRETFALDETPRGFEASWFTERRARTADASGV